MNERQNTIDRKSSNTYYHRTNTSIFLPIVLVIGGIIIFPSFQCCAWQNQLWYRHIMPIRDIEMRRAPLGAETKDKWIETSAFAGMPDEYSECVTQYIELACSAIKAVPLTRHKFYHKDRQPFETKAFPDGANVIQDRDAVVSLVLLPRPDVVRQWSRSKAAKSSGWLSEEDVSTNRGSVYGRTVIFESGELSDEPVALPASPFETWIRSWDLYTPDNDRYFFRELGKLVVTPAHVTVPQKEGDGPVGSAKDEAACLRLGEPGGAKLLGELITVPATLKNYRLRWASIRTKTNVRQFLAYALVDGSGAKRSKRRVETVNGPVSPYVRPLVCREHQPKIKQHDELLLPSPMGWPPSSEEAKSLNGDYIAHEEWCLDDWFPAQKHACWVIREAADSKPLQESFLLMPASEESDRPLFFIALFAETAPRQLVTELATLFQISPDATLNSPETMARLETLYKRVRDFEFAK